MVRGGDPVRAALSGGILKSLCCSGRFRRTAFYRRGHGSDPRGGRDWGDRPRRACGEAQCHPQGGLRGGHRQSRKRNASLDERLCAGGMVLCARGDRRAASGGEHDPAGPYKAGRQGMLYSSSRRGLLYNGDAGLGIWKCSGSCGGLVFREILLCRAGREPGGPLYGADQSWKQIRGHRGA